MKNIWTAIWLRKRFPWTADILLDTGGEMKYYLTQTGKEIVGLRGTDIVIYFLNSYDERTFPRTTAGFWQR